MATDRVTADGRTRLLADGTELPMLGLGVWQVPNGPECVNAVRWALELGYRHIDTAQAYGNEESVGQGLRESGVPREEVFITTKFYPARRDPAAEAERSLACLGVDHVDLYIIHPDGTGLKQITEQGNFCGSPKWTADGRRVIAYCMTAEQTLANRRPAPVQ